jgi:transposase-like protein
MKKSKVVELFSPEPQKDLLTEVAREGARKMLEVVLAEEVQSFIEAHSSECLDDGRQRVVRNGFLPERQVQTGLGDVAVRAPRVRDRGDGSVKFTSSILPPYLRRAKSVEELLPWLYLKGISTNDFGEALQSLLGKEAPGLSSSSIARLKASWEQEWTTWRKRDLSKKRYVYFWADGIYCGIRGEDERMCLLVIIGVTDQGKKELVGLEDGYRESEASWLGLLRDLKERGLRIGPQLAIGDGALGFWKALRQVYPKTAEQRCWQHKTINVLDKLPKALRGKGLDGLHEIWMAESRKDALKAWERFVSMFKTKYPAAVECLEKDRDRLLTFYDFPAEHWKSIRTTNPIESTFATVRHRSSRAKGCVSRSSILAFAFKLIESAQQRWIRMAGLERFAQIITGVKFIDGISEVELKNNGEAKAA